MYIVCTDLEGILVPEIWINVAERTGIADLRLTTRDISDYDVLMRKRLEILKNHNLTIQDITDAIKTMAPLDGAVAFLNWLHIHTRVIIVSDTFEQFAKPLMEKLGWPTLFCNWLSIDSSGGIVDYHLRQNDGKRKVVEGLNSMNFKVIAIGDSYNDISMLQTAQHGILFCPPDNIKSEYPDFPITLDYTSLKQEIARILP